MLAATGEGSVNGLAKAELADQTTSVYAGETAYPAAYTTYVDSGAVYGHLIQDIDTWRMVPGDTVLAFCDGVLLTLEGDNLVAELNLVDGEGDPVGVIDGENGVNLDGGVVGSELYVKGAPLSTTGISGAPDYVAGSTLGYFGAPNYGQLNGVAAESNYVTELTGRSVDGRTLSAPNYSKSR